MRVVKAMSARVRTTVVVNAPTGNRGDNRSILPVVPDPTPPPVGAMASRCAPYPYRGSLHERLAGDDRERPATSPGLL